MKRKSIFAAICVFAVLFSLAFPAAAAENPFTDVKSDDYFYNSVLWAYDNEITSGTGDGLFSPNRPCTRAQVVTFLWRSQGQPEPENTQLAFTDVPENSYYYKAVLWAVEQGITSGTDVTRFSPNARCSRNQVATFLWRLAGCPQPQIQETPFTDVPQNSYYYNAVLWAVEQGITSGTGEYTFSPQSNCSRGQIVTFLYRAMAPQE